MDQVSRPFQIGLVLVLGFAGLWFAALRPKTGTGGGTGGSTPAPQPAAQAPKSAIPGGLGRAVDKARTAKTQGDAAAVARPNQVDAAAEGRSPAKQNTTATPVQTPSGSAGVVRTGAAAIGLLETAVQKTIGADDAVTAARRAAAQRAVKAHRLARPGFATPAKIRAALAKRHAVVLLFYTARSSDDRAVRREIGAIDRGGGRVQAWGVSVQGLSRFKNVLQGVQVLQSPTVVVLSHHNPYVFPGYTDHAEINQATSVALRRKRG